MVNLIYIIIILSLIALSLFLLNKKSFKFLPKKNELNNIKIISLLNLGQQQKIVTIKINNNNQETNLVLGVTSQNINCLHVLNNNENNINFSEVLNNNLENINEKNN